MGYGDDMMATYYARKLSEKYGKKVAVGNGSRYYYSEVFDNNPYLMENPLLKKAKKLPDDTLWLENYPGCRPYIDYQSSNQDKLVFKDQGDRGVGDVFLTDQELVDAYTKIKNLVPFVLIEPSIKGTISASNKDWGFERWQAVTKGVSAKHKVVQVLHQFSTPLKGVESIEVNSFRESLAILYFSSYFLGSEGGMHHASAALGVPGQVIFGGFISPDITGYKIHRNHYIDGGISPCGSLLECEHCRVSMASILPETILTATRRSHMLRWSVFFDRIAWRLLDTRRFGYRALKMKIMRKLA